MDRGFTNKMRDDIIFTLSINHHNHMKKKIIGLSVVILAIAGGALASSVTGQFISAFAPYTQIQSISQVGSSFPINVYKVIDGTAVCYVSQVGSGTASISCVPTK
jgi:ABC-type phosphate transport system substrate-binding protein